MFSADCCIFYDAQTTVFHTYRMINMRHCGVDYCLNTWLAVGNALDMNSDMNSLCPLNGCYLPRARGGSISYGKRPPQTACFAWWASETYPRVGRRAERSS